MIKTDFIEEATRILETAGSSGVILRFLGALAFQFHCPTYRQMAPGRVLTDFDVAGLGKQSGKIITLLTSLGYTADESFNHFYGRDRLMFIDASNKRVVDVFLDRFVMCHTIDLRDRLGNDQRTVPLAELLMTKLQIVELNLKDALDIRCLLKDHTVGDHDNECINAGYIAKLCSEDWGLYKTLTMNIKKNIELLDEGNLSPADKENIAQKLQLIVDRIESMPKPLRWKLRASVGERRPWYQLPESRMRDGKMKR